MYTGIVGALGAVLSAYVSPDSFPVLLSIKFLVGSGAGRHIRRLPDRVDVSHADGAVGIFTFIRVRLRRGAVAKRQY